MFMFAVTARACAVPRSQQVIAAALLTLSSLFAAAIGRAAEAEATIQFSIPAQSIESALMTFSQQARLQVISSGEDLNGLQSTAVMGAYTATAALGRLLQGSGLSFKRAGQSAVSVGYFVINADKSSRRSGSIEPAAQGSSATNLADGALEEVIVSATRHAELLSRVPLSVATFNQDQMDQLGVKDFSQVANRTPGVTFVPGTNDVSIRGISSNAGAATTGLYIDDTPFQVRQFGVGANAALPAVFDLDRIEILRGPQGTLFGSGSEGGTVRYITAQPSLTKFSGYGRAEGAYTQDGSGSYEAGIAVGGPIIADALGFRASAWFRHDPGYVDRVNYNTGQVTDPNANWGQTAVVRAALTWAPIDGLQITPGVYFQRRYVGDASTYWEGISNPDNGSFLNGNPVRLTDNDKFTLPTLKMEFDSGALQFISNTAYFDREEQSYYDASIYNESYFQQFTPAPLLTPTGPDDARIGVDYYYSPGSVYNHQINLTQEFRVQSNDPTARFTWVTGLFYGRERQRNTETIIAPQFTAITQSLFGGTVADVYGSDLVNGEDAWLADSWVTDEQTALFGDATFKIIDALKLTAGVRVARTKVSFQNSTDGPFNGGLTHNSGSEQETPVTPKVSLSWQLSAQTMIYGTAAKGYRPGGANTPISATSCATSLSERGLTGAPVSYNADSVWSYELGAKGRTPSGTLSYDFSVFRVNWSNIQQADYLSECGNTYIGNFGHASSTGFDLDVHANVLESVLVELAMGYADARYTSTTRAGPSATAPIIANDGDRLPSSANTGVGPFSADLGLNYKFQVAAHDGFARVDYQFHSAAGHPIPAQDPATVSYDPAIPTIGATSFVQVRTGLNFGGVDVSVFVDNLFNADPLLTRTHQDKYTLLYLQTTFRPRTGGLTATYRF